MSWGGSPRRVRLWREGASGGAGALGMALLLSLCAASPAHAASLATPSGVVLRLLGDRPTLRPEPFGFTIEIAAELTNDGPEAVHVLAALAAERSDLVVEVNNQRQVCGHHFLWWDWDCFTYCNLPSDPQYLSPICEEDLRIAPAEGTPAPTPVAEATPPADIVYGVVASTDIEKIATALDLDPETVRLGAPPLRPGDTWHLLLHVPVVLAPGTPLPSFAVTAADDLGFVSQVLPLQVGDCAPPPAGMVAWWPLGEVHGATAVHDIAPLPDSTTDNVGTPQPGGQVGFPNGPDPVAGEVGGALFFSGTDDIVQVADDPDLNFGKFDLSIDAWISPVQLGPTIIQPIVEKLALPLPLPNPPTGTGYSLYVEGQRLHAAIGDGGQLALYASDPATLIPFAPTWTHVAMTLDRAAGAVTFYINGAAVPAQTPTPAIPAGSTTNGAPLVIGHSALPADGLGEIAIDELEIFRRALSQPEVQALYDAGAKGKCPPCAGDCDGSGDVSIAELITLVSIALGNLQTSVCTAADTDHDGTITIAELVAAVNSALNGCAILPTVTPTPTSTRAPGVTVVATTSPTNRPASPAAARPAST